MKLLPELFVDPLTDLIIAGISTASAENSLTLIFDPLTGKYVGNKKLNLNEGDRVYCGACGLHMEQNANVFRRLTIHPEGLPRPDSAGTGVSITHPVFGRSVLLTDALRLFLGCAHRKSSKLRKLELRRRKLAARQGRLRGRSNQFRWSFDRA